MMKSYLMLMLVLVAFVTGCGTQSGRQNENADDVIVTNLSPEDYMKSLGENYKYDPTMQVTEGRGAVNVARRGPFVKVYHPVTKVCSVRNTVYKIWTYVGCY